MDSLLLVIFAYLYGSVLFGEHIAKYKGVDIRAVGSGNVGATNVGRALGKKYALLVFLLDLSKGLIPMLLARLYYGLDSWTAFFVGLASLLGHMYPIFHGFKRWQGCGHRLWRSPWHISLSSHPFHSPLGPCIQMEGYSFHSFLECFRLCHSAFIAFLSLQNLPYGPYYVPSYPLQTQRKHL